MNYWELHLATPDEDTQELLIAELAERGFEGFVQPSAQVLEAYVPSEVPLPVLADLAATYGARVVRYAAVEQQNWNAAWEASYDSVAVDDALLIYPEHRPPDAAQRAQFRHLVCVQPQMSFGTGHHATTRLMVRGMQGVDFAGTNVLDMGCGTGILGIHALQRGAQACDLVDIDAWAVTSTQENLGRNGWSGQTASPGDLPLRIRVWQGGVDSLAPDDHYDVILANIHRNVLLADAAAYVAHLRPGGSILLSGFLHLDDAAIVTKFQSLGLVPAGQWTEAEWVCRQMRRPAAGA